MAWAHEANIRGPKGDKGDAGEPSSVPGPQGPKGDPGDLPEAPVDGQQYARRDATWTVVTGGDPLDNEVFIGPDEPGGTFELWYDTEAAPPAPAVWVQMTQAEYDALPSTDPATLYVIVG